MSSTRPSKADRRDEARAAALRLREEQQRTAKRQRTIAVSALLVGLAILAAVVVVILSQGNRSALEGVHSPQGSTLSGGIPVGADGVAGSTSGSADDAVEVEVYSDFMCPFCALFEETNGPMLAELRESGDIVLTYHPVSILDRFSEGSAYSTRSATAVALVADQAPEAFVELNDLLFANQPAEGTPGLSDAEIADLAREAGVPDEVATQIEDGSYMADAADGERSATFVEWTEKATEQATKDLGGLGTPAIVIDGEVLDTAEYDWREEGRLAAAIEAARG